MVRPRVFMDFSVNDEPYGRVVFELFNDTAPKTTDNFRALCTGEKGLSASGNPLYYKNSIIHRSIKDFMIQGGDFPKRNGTGGESIYGGTFSDEDLQRPLDSPALLCMANKGSNTNGSQFFITLKECPHLNGKHVVFGRVIKGYEQVVLKLAEVPVDEKDRPKLPIVITACGELELRKHKEPDSNNVASRLDTKKSKKRQHRHRSRSSEREERHRKKERKAQSKERSPSPAQGKDIPVNETEEEYDARLEREEHERKEAERKRVLEHIQKTYSDAATSQGGVRFKGRGRMKYIDPEIRRSRS